VVNSTISGKNPSHLGLDLTAHTADPFEVSPPSSSSKTHLCSTISSLLMFSVVFSLRSHDKATDPFRHALVFEEHWPGILHKVLSLVKYVHPQTCFRVVPSPRHWQASALGMRRQSSSTPSQQGANCSSQSRKTDFSEAESQIAGKKSYHFNWKISSAGSGLQKRTTVSFCIRHQQVI